MFTYCEFKEGDQDGKTKSSNKNVDAWIPSVLLEEARAANYVILLALEPSDEPLTWHVFVCVCSFVGIGAATSLLLNHTEDPTVPLFARLRFTHSLHTA